jgi:hypothetical protein
METRRNREKKGFVSSVPFVRVRKGPIGNNGNNKETTV